MPKRPLHLQCSRNIRLFISEFLRLFAPNKKLYSWKEIGIGMGILVLVLLLAALSVLK